MNLLVVGNIIAFIAAALSLVIGFIKNRNKIIYVQTVQFLLFSISTFILGGITGTIANLIGMARNILCYKEKLTKNMMILTIFLSTILTLMFNNLGVIGLLPLINTIIYTVFINEKNPLKFKILILVTVTLWLIYDITIKSYSSAIFEIFSLMAGLFTTYQIYKNSKKQQT